MMETTFPLDVFPDPIANFCREFAHASKAVPEYVACGVLATISSIGADSILHVKPGYIEYPNLYLAVVGKPSMTKSAPLKAAISPLMDIQKEEYKEFILAYEDWERRLKFCTNRKEKKELEKEEPIPSQTRIFTKGTIEGLFDMLNKNQKRKGPAHVIYYRDELNAFFQDMNAYRGGGSDLEHYLSLFNGCDIHLHNKHSHMLVSDATVTVLGSIQPTVLREAMEIKGNGLIERFLFAVNEKKPMVSVLKDVMNETTLDLYNKYIVNLINRYEKREYSFRHPDVEVKVQEIYNWFHEHGASHDSGAFKKWEINFHKLCINIGILYMKKKLDVPVIEKAEKLIKYFAKDWLDAYEITEKSEELIIRDDLIDWIRASGGGVSLTDINRKRKFQIRSELLRNILGELVNDGILKKNKIKGSGRPTILFSFNGESDV